MATVVDLTGTISVIFNRSGIVVLKLVAARDAAPPTTINHYAQHTIVWALAPSPNTSIVGYKIGSGFEAGDIVEWFTSSGGTAVSASYWDENDVALGEGSIRGRFIKMPDSKWYELM